MIKVSAPGKLMLFGEHAVVHNKPCIVAAVDYRIGVSLEKREDRKILLNAPDINFKNYVALIDDLVKPHPKKVRFVLTSVFNFFEKYKIKSGLDIETKSEFSDRVGLGSSSAVVVSTIKALSELFEIEIEKKEIFDLSYKTVLDIQGVGSGFDVAAAIYGGFLLFVKGGKTIKPIKTEKIPLIVGYTGIKADTSTLVKRVFERLKENPKGINKIFGEIEKIVSLAEIEMESQNWEKIGKLMNLNQDLLRNLGVSSKELENLVSAALKGGAYGAKLSGAGGGDCMIAVARKEEQDRVKKEIERVGGEIIEVKIPAKGVRVE